MSKLTIEGVEYHRNGCHGDGFHVVSFREFRGKTKLIGIVFPGDGQVAVINPGDYREGFSFEFYDKGLRQAVADYEKAESAKLRAKATWNYELYDTESQSVIDEMFTSEGEIDALNAELRDCASPCRWIKKSNGNEVL